MLVRGQRVFLHGRPGVVIEAEARGFVTVELDDGPAVVDVRELVPAESVESAKARQT